MNTNQPGRDVTCSTCRYYREQDQAVGACHRYPPAFAGEQSPRELHHWRFPMVSPSSWCGEHVASADQSNA